MISLGNEADAESDIQKNELSINENNVLISMTHKNLPSNNKIIKNDKNERKINKMSKDKINFITISLNFKIIVPFYIFNLITF